MLSAKDITLHRSEKTILEGVSFQIEQGEVVGIIGESGIGKTSLLKILAGQLDASKGEVFLDDQRIVGPALKLIPGYDDIQLVNQDFALDPYHTVEENVRGKILHLHQKEQSELVEEVLELFRLSHLRTRVANTLSGGEQQRLSLARALACEPRVLLLDEPFVHLDMGLRLDVMHYLTRLNEVRNTTIVLVSHDGGELMGFVNKIIHLALGKVQRESTPNEMYYQPESLEQGRLLGMINEVEVSGERIVFRPNEYDLEEGEHFLEVTFERSVSLGLFVINYFRTQAGDSVSLASSRQMEDISGFYVRRKW